MKKGILRPLDMKLGRSSPLRVIKLGKWSILGKIVERMAGKQLQDFLEHASAIVPFQTGFHPGYGMETLLFTLTDGLHRQLD